MKTNMPTNTPVASRAENTALLIFNKHHTKQAARIAYFGYGRWQAKYADGSAVSDYAFDELVRDALSLVLTDAEVYA